jgi:hypothetical protein
LKSSNEIVLITEIEARESEISFIYYLSLCLPVAQYLDNLDMVLVSNHNHQNYLGNSHILEIGGTNSFSFLNYSSPSPPSLILPNF